MSTDSRNWQPFSLCPWGYCSSSVVVLADSEGEWRQVKLYGAAVCSLITPWQNNKTTNNFFFKKKPRLQLFSLIV